MTREEEQSGRMRNRSYNLSWRSELFPSEKLLKGTLSQNPWNPDQGNSMPEMSLETRFAKRLNVDLGDTMTFDVQGVEVEGRITSLRQIRWTSFQPNFFIQFQPGVLEDAPKTWLAGIIADTGQKATIQKFGKALKSEGLLVLEIPRQIKYVGVHVGNQKIKVETEWGNLDAYLPSHQEMLNFQEVGNFQSVEVIYYESDTGLERAMYLYKK